MSRSNISDLVHEKIDLLNELQTRIVVLRALDQQRVGSNFTEANDNLRQCLAYWSRLAKQNIRYSNASIDETMDVVHEIFGKESLRSDGDFSVYIKNFAVIDQAQCAQIMNLFCNCLVMADLKNSEQKEEFFMSFPPSEGDLFCLDGTQERLEIIERQLLSNELYLPFVGASDLTILNLTDALKYDVKQGNQVHIPKYLEKSLSLRSDHVSPHSQSQIPFTKSFLIHREYPEMLKKFLRTDVERLLRNRFDEINETIRDLRSKLPGRDFKEIKEEDNDALREIRLGLKKFGEDNFFVYSEKEDVGYYRINFDALKKAAFDLPCLRFLDKLRVEDGFAEAGKASSDKDLAECRKFILDPVNIFSADGVNNLAILATRGDPNDKLLALDTIWMLSQQLLSSSNKIFFDTVSLIMQNNANFFDEAREELGKFLPTYSKKINDILRHRQFLEADSHFNQINEGSHIYDLIDCGYDTDFIVRKIASFSNPAELNANLEIISEDVTEEQNTATCKRLINRPDLSKILESIKDKADGADLNHDFVGLCLKLLETQRNLYGYCNAATKIGNDSVFTGSKIFHFIAENDSADLMVDLAPTIQSRRDILLQVFDNEFPLDTAVRKGSKNFILEVFKIFGPEDRDHLRLSYKGRLLSCVAAKYGQVKSMLALSKSGYDLFAQDGNGNNALHYAVCYDQKKILDVLFDISSSTHGFVDGIDAQNSEGKTPLLFAFEREKKDLIGLIYKHGANPLIQDNRGRSPMSYALDRNDPEPLKELVKAGFDLGGNKIMYQLLKSGKKDAASTLIQAGFNIDNRDRGTGETLVHYVIRNNDLELLPILRSFGADFSIPDRHKITPLVKAAAMNSEEAVKVLMGFNPDLRNEFKIALDSGDEQSIRILRKLGFDINAKNSDGATMLHEIIAKQIDASGRRSYSDEFLELVKFGADASIVDSRGFAADYLAIKMGMTKVVTSISDDRFDSIIKDQIRKGDVSMLKKLEHYSSYRCIDFPEKRDLMLSRCYDYQSYAKVVEASSQVFEFIAKVVDKRKQSQGEMETESQDISSSDSYDGYDADFSDIDREIDSPSPSGNSVDFRDGEVSQFFSPLPPQPTVEISTRAISLGSEADRTHAPAATKLSSSGKAAVNDNSNRH